MPSFAVIHAVLHQSQMTICMHMLEMSTLVFGTGLYNVDLGVWFLSSRTILHHYFFN